MGLLLYPFLVGYVLAALFLGLNSAFLFYFDCCHHQKPKTIILNLVTFLVLSNVVSIACLALSLLYFFGRSIPAFSLVIYVLVVPLLVMYTLSFVAKAFKPKWHALFHSFRFGMLGLFPYWLITEGILKKWMSIATYL